MNRLTKEQAAIIGAFTGTLVGPFNDVQEYAEKKLGRSIITQELADPGTVQELKRASLEDLKALAYQRSDSALSKALGPLTKPEADIIDWDDIGAEYIYAAMDFNGQWHAFTARPTLTIWAQDISETGLERAAPIEGPKTPLDQWENTLIERPGT